MSFLRVTCDAARGLQCPKETCKIWTEKIDWRQGIPSNHHDARDQLFRIFPSGKTGTRRREHRVYWFPPSVYWFPICDGHNCELLNSMMTQICLRNRPALNSKVKNVFVRTKPFKTKGCKFGEAWRMNTGGHRRRWSGERKNESGEVSG